MQPAHARTCPQLLPTLKSGAKRSGVCVFLLLGKQRDCSDSAAYSLSAAWLNTTGLAPSHTAACRLRRPRS